MKQGSFANQAVIEEDLEHETQTPKLSNIIAKS